MGEKIIVPSNVSTNILTAAEFLYYDSQRILERDPSNSEAREIQRLMRAIILSRVSAFPAQAVLEAITQKYKAEEEIRFNEREFPSIYIATVGLENVGKALVTEYLKEKYGFEAHPLSDQLKQIALALGFQQPLDRNKLFLASKTIKGALGDAVLLRFAETLFARIDQPNRVLFDGIRVPGEAEWLYQRESAASITSIVLAIITGEKDEKDYPHDLIARYVRSLNRGGDKDPKENSEAAYDLFEAQSKREADGIQEAITKYATCTIENRYGEMPATYQQIDDYMEQLNIAPVN